MLCEITIENVAVIEKATARFGPGFNVLTGETGAGKSILIDSINAILGNRTSREIVRTGAAKASIWATFRDVPAECAAGLEKAGYEPQEELLLYREISADGKSACRINGMPATASILRDICGTLLNIHGQHDNQSLLNPARHIGILDAFAQNDEQHSAYYTVYRALCAAKREMDALSLNEDEKARRTELLRFQIDELESAELKPGEEKELSNQRNLMRNAQTLTQQLGTAYDALSGGDEETGAAELLGGAATSLENASKISEDFAELFERVNDLYYAARDVAAELSGLLEQQEYSPEALEEVESRLDQLYRLRQKYGAADEEGLVQYLQQAQAELAAIESGEERLEELEEKVTGLYEEGKKLADVLTKTRLDAFERFNAQIAEALQFLNMPGIHFALSHKKGPLAGSGQDTLEFFISTNPGEAPKPLAKIASGGELSRIMLAVKSALADKDDIGTVIYDEIDTGVSGLAAARIGEKLRQTSAGRQVICITHTAQIAAEAQVHLLIEKNIENGRAYTKIDTLDENGRIHEVARMISGDKITELTLANAKEMLALHNA